LILVDDGSTDETPSILNGVQHARVSVIRNEVNRGLPNSLNIGFSQASGEYLTWTSDDNLFAPTAIEEMASHLDENPDVAFVYADYWSIDEEGSVINRVSVLPPASLEESDCVGACFLYRRVVHETIGDYDSSVTLAEDYDYWLRVYQSFEMARLPKPLYYYRKHSGSLTHQEGLIRQQRAAEKVRARWVGPDPYLYPSRFARSLARVYFDLAFAAYRDGDLPRTRSCALAALRWDPRWLRNRGLLSILSEALAGRRIASLLRHVF
jgi:glycosyltransferase involved in cell wall biosynthesis